MKILEKVNDIELFSQPQPSKIYGKGEDGLLGIPHSVIRDVFLKYFNATTAEYMDMYSLALTCKYLHADVMKVLSDRAVRLFGQGATPLALNCLFRLQYKKAQGERNYRWEMLPLWSISKLGKYSFLFYIDFF